MIIEQKLDILSSECNSPQPRAASEEQICDESKSVICDINRHQALSQAVRQSHHLTQSHGSILKEKSCELSPSQSILSNTNSSDKTSKQFARKSFKRVSFEEQPKVIEDIPEYIQETQDDELDLDCDLPLLEEVCRGSSSPSPSGDSVKERPASPPVTMAAAEEQIEMPAEAGEGEQMIPKKERKPHIKGITFREFDVSMKVIVSSLELTAAFSF